MQLRQGKTKSILESSIDSALLAVETYNKPRAVFRSECYITLMIIAWTRLFHAFFYHNIGDKYYHKDENNRYVKVNGERKAWSLKTCINKYNKLKEAVRANIEFFIGLRNKIEHRHVDGWEVDNRIFGECQTLLYNYENLIEELFGSGYTINEQLVYALQCSSRRLPEQLEASKKALSKDMREVLKYIENYRNNLPDEVFSSQDYSIKLIQIPKISNTNRSDLAVEFVRFNELGEEDRKKYDRITALIKHKVVTREGINVGRLRPTNVVNELANKTGIRITTKEHLDLCEIFDIRPRRYERDKFDTNTDYCHYDEVHGDYVYKYEWVRLLIKLFKGKHIIRSEIRKLIAKGTKLQPGNFESTN